MNELRKFGEWNTHLKESCDYFVVVFSKLITWMDTLTESMDQSKTDFDGQGMSKIYNGLEMVAEFKIQGIGNSNQYPKIGP